MGKLIRRLRTMSVGPRSRATAALRNGAELLRESAWRARLTHPTQDGRPDLREVDFSGCDMADFDLSGCRLSRSVFDGASLNRIDLSGSDVSGATFVGATMVGTKLDAVCALDARFDGALMTGATLTAANLSFTSFRHASLANADLSAATFFGADLRNALLLSSSRAGTDFEDADTTCASSGAAARPSQWREDAAQCGAPSFASALQHYSALMNLRGSLAAVGLRAVEAGIADSNDHLRQVRGLLLSRIAWRVPLISACALMLGGSNAKTNEVLWRVVGHSFVSPQLVVAAANCDAHFIERAAPMLADANVPLKCRGAIAAMLLSGFGNRLDSYVERTATTLVSTEREGSSIARKWATRFEELTALVSDDVRFVVSLLANGLIRMPHVFGYVAGASFPPDRNGGPERDAHMLGRCRREKIAYAVFLPRQWGGVATDGAGANTTRPGRP